MDIDFEAETPQGVIQFKGSLNKDEVSTLLRYAILSLLAQGILPVTVMNLNPDDKPTLN